MGSNPGVVLENAMGEIPSLTAVARRLTKLLDDCEVDGFSSSFPPRIRHYDLCGVGKSESIKVIIS